VADGELARARSFDFFGVRFEGLPICAASAAGRLGIPARDFRRGLPMTITATTSPPSHGPEHGPQHRPARRARHFELDQKPLSRKPDIGYLHTASRKPARQKCSQAITLTDRIDYPRRFQ
jgi:hypothetical protein